MRFLISLLLGTTLTSASAAGSTQWLAEPGIESRLHAGEVVIRADFDEAGKRARVRAAILIAASAESVWAVLTDCAHAAQFVPGLKRCRCVGQVHWDGCTLVARDIKYAWYMPVIHDVVRTTYAWPRRIDFELVSGDLRDEHGTWRLEPAPDRSATLLDYEIEAAPKTWWPNRVVERSMIENLRLAMQAVRTRLERPDQNGVRFTEREPAQ